MKELLKIFFGYGLLYVNNDLCNVIVILMELQTLSLLVLLAYNGNQQVKHIDEEY
jgi:hypothetical protein